VRDKCKALQYEVRESEGAVRVASDCDGQGVLAKTRNACMNFTAKHTDSDKLEVAG